MEDFDGVKWILGFQKFVLSNHRNVLGFRGLVRNKSMVLLAMIFIDTTFLKKAQNFSNKKQVLCNVHIQITIAPHHTQAYFPPITKSHNICFNLIVTFIGGSLA